MKNLHKKFENISHSVHLSEAEKSRMREYLLEYQAFRPVMGVGVSRLEGEAKSPLSFLSFKPMPVLIVLALMVTGGASVSAAAQNSLPGDTLYPIKVSVNEKVAGAFAISDDAKASFETSLTDTRLAEAEALVAKGKLSTSTADDIEVRFSAHADNAREHIARLEARNSARAEVEASTLDTVLSTHADILVRASENRSEKGKLIVAIRSKVGQSNSGGVATAALSAGATTSADAKASVRAKATAKTAPAKGVIRTFFESLIGTTTRPTNGTASSSSSTHTETNTGSTQNASTTSGSSSGSNSGSGTTVSGSASGSINVDAGSGNVNAGGTGGVNVSF